MTKYLKNTLFVFIIALTISSCKVKQSIADVVITDKTPTVSPTPSKDTVVTTTTVIIEDTVIQTTITGQTPFEFKDVYNVAVILPLFNDSVKSSYSSSVESNLKDFDISKLSLKSISFIEGMMQSLKKAGNNSKFNIQIYDNQASTFQTNNIINKLGFENIDIIIGPMQTKNIRLVSAFAKKNSISMISPFSHSKSAGSEHSKFIMPQPSLDIHLKAMATFIKDSLTSKNIKIIYPNIVKSEQFAFNLQGILEELNDSIVGLEDKLSYALVEVEANTNDRKNFKMEEYLDEGQKNIVFVLPASTGFVHNMLTKLNEQLKDYEITVFGMPNWKDSKTARLDYYNKLNVHFSNIKWVDESIYETSSFINDYKNDYAGRPTNEAFLAYDVFNFLSILTEKYGLSFTENLQNEYYKGIYSNYHFEATKEKTNGIENASSILRIENDALHIISYEDFKLILEQ